jgi:hypothetical protein
MKITRLTAFFLVLLAIAGFIPKGLAETPEREWLILFYLSGVNDRGLNGFAKDVINQLEKAGSTDKVTIIVQYSILETGKNEEVQFQRDARTLLIKQDKGDPSITSPVIDSSLRTDMASASNLFLFIRRNIAKYPSKKVMLALWGKGEGFRGALEDDRSGQKMSVREIAGALFKARNATQEKLDVLAIDADLMQMAENVYELKDEAGIIVSSEESTFRNDYLYDLILQEAVEDPASSPEKLAGAMVYFAENPISSAIRTDKMPVFMKLLDQWAAAIMNDRAALKIAASAIDTTFHFEIEDSKDLCDFIDRVVESALPDSEVAKLGKDFSIFVKRELIASAHWTSNPISFNNRPYSERSHGLAIYLPDLRYDSNAYEPLTFASNSGWSRFLLALLEEKLKK